MEPENSPYGIIQWYIAKMPHPSGHSDQLCGGLLVDASPEPKKIF